MRTRSTLCGDLYPECNMSHAFLIACALAVIRRHLIGIPVRFQLVDQGRNVRLTGTRRPQNPVSQYRAPWLDECLRACQQPPNALLHLHGTSCRSPEPSAATRPDLVILYSASHNRALHACHSIDAMVWLWLVHHLQFLPSVLP